MKNFIFSLILTVLGSMFGYSQELPKTTAPLSVAQSIDRFAYIHSSYRNNHSLMAGVIINDDDFPSLRLDNFSILESFRNPLDTPDFPYFPTETSISNTLGSIIGNVNISENHDNQVRISIVNINDGSVVKQFTLRNMKIGAMVRNHMLVNDDYLYILLSGNQNSSTIEDGYTGFPFSISKGTRLNHDTPILLQVRISDFRVKTYAFPEGTMFKRGNLTADEDGNIYLQAVDSLISETFYLLGLNTELEVLFKSPEIARVKYDVDLFKTQMLHAKILGNEYLVYWNGVAPGIYNISRGENIISTDLKTGLDWSEEIQFHDVNIESIHHIPGTDKFLLVRQVGVHERVLPWMQVVNIYGERTLFFRERIERTKNGVSSFSRPYIIGSYFDDQKNLHYMAMYNEGGIASLNGTTIADGTQADDTAIIFKGTLQGIDVSFSSKGGLENFIPQSGSVTYDSSDGNNNVVYSGVSDVSNIIVNRQVAEGYTAVPDSYVPSNGSNFVFNADFSNKRVQRTAIANIVNGKGQTTRDLDIIMIVREFADENLSTEVFNENDFAVYPNPASDEVSVRFDSDVEINVKIYNLMGQLIYRKTNIFSGESVDVSSFARGMYIVHFSNNEKSISKKIVLQ